MVTLLRAGRGCGRDALQARWLSMTTGLMIPKSRVVAVAVIAAMNFSSPLNAGTRDYLFEAVKPEIKSSNVAVIAVRLLRKPSRKPVTDAAVVQTRLDMAPDGMAEMTAPVVPLQSPSRPGFGRPTRSIARPAR